MRPTSGVTVSNQGLEGQVWNILDQIYVPKQLSENSFTWHATFPAGSFVPLHLHPAQDEFVYLLEGQMEFVLATEQLKANPGDLVSLPRGIPHSIHNRTAGPVKCLFWVTPTGKLYDYFKTIDGLRDLDQLTKLAADAGVPFVEQGK